MHGRMCHYYDYNSYIVDPCPPIKMCTIVNPTYYDLSTSIIELVICLYKKSMVARQFMTKKYIYILISIIASIIYSGSSFIRYILSGAFSGS